MADEPKESTNTAQQMTLSGQEILEGYLQYVASLGTANQKRHHCAAQDGIEVLKVKLDNLERSVDELRKNTPKCSIDVEKQWDEFRVENDKCLRSLRDVSGESFNRLTREPHNKADNSEANFDKLMKKLDRAIWLSAALFVSVQGSLALFIFYLWSSSQ